ncbi:pyridoxamine 5'-phosphate oxidase family protein [Labrys sp. LIt4]|uniref:pyridoxamine 5'-phosphate oxidase family protein n=1 Tax=Labrys sp. LIt4 TaxID=2821355 RepID=UPI001ADF74D4|nr:pyridoxamine 5'-phosphate oxidase family protein [Labrys sp. LIt4]MBP0581957.1 pyridoxamine 5'-phosphate oxidase family protein [Labrys sp. LIt4]
MSLISTIAELEALYSEPVQPAARIKVLDHVSDQYHAFIQASPFMILASVGPSGVDCSPRGDPAGFVRVADAKTLIIPDRRGNNRLDSLRNIIEDPRVHLLFMIPGIGETLRVVGRAVVSADLDLCASFTMQGKAPRTVIIVTVEEVYTQCQKALVRSKLWDPSTRISRAELPTMGQILSTITRGDFDGEAYDKAYPERLRQTIY